VNGNPALNIAIYPGDVVNVPPDTKIVIYVLGAVRLPGAVQLSTSMPVTLLAAIAAAGGPTDSAKQSDIKIKRRNSTGEENLIKVNLKDILSGKTEDMPLSEGDIITVPESFF
jgi:polysaccharide export outer membrane protein